MANGTTKPIEMVQPEDKIMSFEGRQPLEIDTVTMAHNHGLQKVVEVTVGGVVIGVTPGHRFLTPKYGWIEIGQLFPGEQLINANNALVKIRSISPHVTKEKVYNLTIAKNHTYIANGFRVHNIKHKGGLITDQDPKTHKDNLDITAQEGEFVLSRAATDALGIDFLEYLNKALTINGRK
jgi:hypothetical protein